MRHFSTLRNALVLFALLTFCQTAALYAQDELKPPREAGIAGITLFEEGGRVIVSEVSLDTTAGAKKGDVVTAIEGKRVTSLTQLMDDSRKISEATNKPESLRLTVLRDGRSHEVTIALSEERPVGTRPVATDPPVPGTARTEDLGVTELNEVVHVRPGSSPAEAGIQPLDIVSSVDGKRTPNFRALTVAITASRGRPFIPIQITRNGKLVNLEIEDSTTIALHPQPAAPAANLATLAERVRSLEAQVEILNRTVAELTKKLDALAPVR